MLLHSITLFFVLLASAFAVELPVNLGTAGTFAILTKTGITTTGVTSITGDMGTSPIVATAITGFGLMLFKDGTHSTSSLVTGNVYAASHAVPTPSNLGTAVFDMETAYLNAEGRQGATQDKTDLNSGSVEGLTLTPGLYKWSSNVGFTSSVTFAGSDTDIWILQIAGDVVVGSGAEVFLTDGALAENIFWQVAGYVDVGTTAKVKGVFLVKTHMAFKTGSSLNGAALAQTAVTLDATTIVKKSNAPVRYLRSI